MRNFFSSPIYASAAFATLISVTAAGAATAHRYAAVSSSGSEGATAYTNTSAAGSALQGTVASAPDTKFTIPFGVLGEYTYGSQFGIGVGGVSSTGYGVAAEAMGTNPALLALAKGDGAAGLFSATGLGDGLDVSATSGTGLSVTSEHGTVIGSLTGNSGSQIAGVFASSAYHGGRVALGLDSGQGAVISGGGGPVLDVQSYDESAAVLSLSRYHYGGTQNSNYLSQAFLVQGNTQNRSGALDSTRASDVQIAGDVYVTGAVYTACGAFPATSSTTCAGSSASNAAIRSRTGQTYDAYAARDASATVEDEGETQLIRGASHVDLDRDFASTISTSRPYMVFVTPLGKSKQLYVTNRTMAGFDVRETDGQSTVAYDYRIVAAAADAPRPRMVVRAARTPVVAQTQDAGAALLAKSVQRLEAARKAHRTPNDLESARTK